MKNNNSRINPDSVLIIKKDQNALKFARRVLNKDAESVILKKIGQDLYQDVINKYRIRPKEFFERNQGTAILVKMRKVKSPDVQCRPSLQLNSGPRLNTMIPKRRVMSPKASKRGKGANVNRSYYLKSEVKNNRSIFEFYKKKKRRRFAFSPTQSPNISLFLSNPVRINSPKATRINLDLSSPTSKPDELARLMNRYTTSHIQNILGNRKSKNLPSAKKHQSDNLVAESMPSSQCVTETFKIRDAKKSLKKGNSWDDNPLLTSTSDCGKATPVKHFLWPGNNKDNQLVPALEVKKSTEINELTEEQSRYLTLL